MLSLRHGSIVLVCFGLAHFLAGLVSSVIGIFILGRWDPKWGSPLGAFWIDLTVFQPVFTGINMLGTTVGLGLGWDVLRQLRLPRLIALAGVTAVISISPWAALNFIGSRLGGRSGDFFQTTGLVWGVFGSVIGWIIVIHTAGKRNVPSQAV